MAKYENPLAIKYFSFASEDNSVAKFFYGCEGENVYGEEDFKQKCQYDEELEIEYTKFYKIDDIPGTRSEQFALNFPFFVKAERDARILLTTGPKADRNDAEYNFRNDVFRFRFLIIIRDIFLYYFYLFILSSFLLCHSDWRMGQHEVIFKIIKFE